MALTMLCDICEEPCKDGYHLVSIEKVRGALLGAVLGFGRPDRVAICQRCGSSTTIGHLAQLRGVAFTDAPAATV